MNELLKVELNDNQEPIMSARGLHDELDNLDNFTDFFIKASEYKVALSKLELKTLRSVLKSFIFKFNSVAITYLIDAIDAEITLPCKQEMPREFKEKQLQNSLLDNFCYAFPDYELVGAEIPVAGVGRIDVLAKDKESKRPVIIELKTGSRNPNKQLLAYATKYDNPILVGITENNLSSANIHKGIFYFTFSELKRSSKQWVL